MIDAELKQMWTEGLRSGRFNQATDTLTRTDRGTQQVVGHCCLGVFIELYKDRHPGEIVVDSELNRTCVSYGYKNEVAETDLPAALLDRLGLTYNEQEKLVSMNDVERANFTQIADWIDDNL